MKTSVMNLKTERRPNRSASGQGGVFGKTKHFQTRLRPGDRAGQLLAATICLLLPFLANAEEPKTSHPAGRQVFAHYMVCFFNSVEFYKQEIELAQRHGIDGFALNCGQWKGTNYEKAGRRIYQAAKELDSGFKLFFSPFQIGRYEITNEEYEQFDPGHRKYRDGFSWRDREPVIYVSWRDAVKYCNWLSKESGLRPACDEKT